MVKSGRYPRSRSHPCLNRGGDLLQVRVAKLAPDSRRPQPREPKRRRRPRTRQPPTPSAFPQPPFANDEVTLEPMTLHRRPPSAKTSKTSRRARQPHSARLKRAARSCEKSTFTAATLIWHSTRFRMGLEGRSTRTASR